MFLNMSRSLCIKTINAACCIGFVISDIFAARSQGDSFWDRSENVCIFLYWVWGDEEAVFHNPKNEWSKSEKSRLILDGVVLVFVFELFELVFVVFVVFIVDVFLSGLLIVLLFVLVLLVVGLVVGVNFDCYIEFAFYKFYIFLYRFCKLFF